MNEYANYLSEVVEKTYNAVMYLKGEPKDSSPIFFGNNLKKTFELAKELEVRKLPVNFPEGPGEISISYSQRKVDKKERKSLLRILSTRERELEYASADDETCEILKKMFVYLGTRSYNGPLHQIEVGCLGGDICDNFSKMPNYVKKLVIIGGIIHDLGRGPYVNYSDTIFKKHADVGGWFLESGGLGDDYIEREILKQKEVNNIAEIVRQHNSSYSDIEKSGKLTKEKKIVKEADICGRLGIRGSIENIKRVISTKHVSEWGRKLPGAFAIRRKTIESLERNTHFPEELKMLDTTEEYERLLIKTFIRLENKNPESKHGYPKTINMFTPFEAMYALQ